MEHLVREFCEVCVVLEIQVRLGLGVVTISDTDFVPRLKVD